MNPSKRIILAIQWALEMINCDNNVDKELFLDKFEKLSLKIEQLAEEISKMKNKLDQSNKINRSFGLEAIQNSKTLTFANDIHGIGSPSKKYIMSIRAVSELWKGRKNDFLLVIRQQEKETQMDIKALGIRIPVDDIKTISHLAKQILSIMYVSTQLRGIEINVILRDLLTEINNDGYKMLQEVKEKMIFQ
jgi:hypothetical protein